MMPEKKLLTDSDIDQLLTKRKVPDTPNQLAQRIMEVSLTKPLAESSQAEASLLSELGFIWHSCFQWSPLKIVLPIFILGIMIGGLLPKGQTTQQITSETAIKTYFSQTYHYGYTP